MVDFELLRVSLTKNGYFKIAWLLRHYSRFDVLDHVYGDVRGVNLAKSQVANMLDVDMVSGEIPEYWDQARVRGEHELDAFCVLAMLFSHHRLIALMQAGSQGRPEFTGYFLREDLGEKEYTNFAYALGCFGLSEYRRGAGAVSYDLSPVIYHLRNSSDIVAALLRRKLQRAGWRDPDRFGVRPDREFAAELRANNVHGVLSMEWSRFNAFLAGRLRMEEPVGRFGLTEVGLFQG